MPPVARRAAGRRTGTARSALPEAAMPSADRAALLDGPRRRADAGGAYRLAASGRRPWRRPTARDGRRARGTPAVHLARRRARRSGCSRAGPPRWAVLVEPPRVFPIHSLFLAFYSVSTWTSVWTLAHARSWARSARAGVTPQARHVLRMDCRPNLMCSYDRSHRRVKHRPSIWIDVRHHALRPSIVASVAARSTRRLERARRTRAQEHAMRPRPASTRRSASST